MKLSSCSLLVLATLFAVACSSARTPGSQACTEIGCTDALTIDLAQLSWQPGSYQLEITADGATTRCQATLPLPPCGTPGVSCDGPSARVGESGCALDPSAHSLSDITLESTPASVQVTVLYEGAPFAAGSFTPQYQVSRPNGPQCEPECRTAHEQLSP